MNTSYNNMDKVFQGEKLEARRFGGRNLPILKQSIIE